MKNWLIVFATLTALNGCAKGVDVPDPVSQAFRQKFPAAEKIKWERENEMEYEAEFILDGIEMSATFSPDGKWNATEREITMAQVPASAMDAVKGKYPEYSVKEAEEVETAGGKMYEMELKSGRKELEVMVNADGSDIKEQADED